MFWIVHPLRLFLACLSTCSRLLKAFVLIMIFLNHLVTNAISINRILRDRSKLVALTLSLSRYHIPMILKLNHSQESLKVVAKVNRDPTILTWLSITRKQTHLRTMILGYLRISWQTIVVVMIMKLILMWKRTRFKLHMHQSRASRRYRHNRANVTTQVVARSIMELKTRNTRRRPRWQLSQ